MSGTVEGRKSWSLRRARESEEHTGEGTKIRFCQCHWLENEKG